MIEGIPIAFWYVVTGLGGLLAGSFAGAQVWRLRAAQLASDKAAGEPYDKAELRRLKPLIGVSARTDRSRCLECGHQLAWHDLLPLVSWLSTGGRCRYCKKHIGWFEPVIELGTTTFFVASVALWPGDLSESIEVIRLVLWLLAGVPLAILFAYDAKWFLLPDKAMIALWALAGVFSLVTLLGVGITWASVSSLVGAVLAIAGLYYLLHAVSRGAWVGFGDVTLGVGLGLLLGRWELAVLAVFAANLIGTLLVLPSMLRGRLARGSQLPFGPLLMLGTFVAFFFGAPIIDWYLGLL